NKKYLNNRRNEPGRVRSAIVKAPTKRLYGRNELMPQRDQHTAYDGGSQVQIHADACWNELVQQRLPATLESQARDLKAFVRVRGLPNAQALLRAVLWYVLSLSSLKQLSGWSRLVHVSSTLISAQGWHKRLQQCGP